MPKEYPKRSDSPKEPHKTGRILVMDDEEIMRELFGDMLKMLGYDAELAGDGQSAVEMFAEAKEQGHPFVKVILDLTVPFGMGGEEALREMLKIDPAVKAVISSGFPNDPVIVNFAYYGFRAALLKPYNFKELQETLNRLD